MLARHLTLVAAGALAVACRAGPPAAAPAAAAAEEPAPIAPESCAAVRERARVREWRAADRRPVAVRQSWPADVGPRGPRGESVSGYVLAYTVDTAGRVDSATVLVSTNVGPRYQAALRRLAPAWRFRPARWGGCAVPYTVVDTGRIVIGPAR